MKLLIRLSFSVLFVLGMAVACSDDDDPVGTDDPTLSVEPSKDLSFSAAATESYNIAVATNQDSWKVVSDQSWCIVTKTNSGFTVTAKPNTSTNASLPAKLTVTAGQAKPVVINATQGGLGATLSVSPETSVSFSHQGTGSFEFTVTTNQDSWDVVSDKPWCIITKDGNKFTVTAEQNFTPEKLTATITVSAGNAANVDVSATQGAGKTVAVDDGVTIWDDTHWRVYQLAGNPKSVESQGELIEFNADGRITYEGSKAKDEYYTKWEYNAKGQMVKKISRHSKESGERITEYEYGDHAKYVPFFIELDNDNIDYLVKGMTAIKITQSNGKTTRFDFNITESAIKASIDGASLDIAYSGDYPVSIKLIEGETEITKTYKYGKNHKYSEIAIKENSTEEGSIEDVVTYTTAETIYLLPVKEEWKGEWPSVSTKEYNPYGELMKDNNNTYSNYIDDENGNWVERTVNGTTKETRTITYY